MLSNDFSSKKYRTNSGPFPAEQNRYVVKTPLKQITNLGLFYLHKHLQHAAAAAALMFIFQGSYLFHGELFKNRVILVQPKSAKPVQDATLLWSAGLGLARRLGLRLGAGLGVRQGLRLGLGV